MTSIKLIKQRIRSVKNTSQITKAMEVVSATKMRKSQEFAIKARPYAHASLEMLRNLLSRTPILPVLLQKREVKISALLIVTSDKGLAGAFNANVIKKAEDWISEKMTSGESFILITVGKKARDFFERRKIAPEESFWGFGDYSTLDETVPIANLILNGFLYGRWDSVEAVYTNFRTTLRQETVLKKILPATEKGIEEVVEGIFPEKGKFAADPKLEIKNLKFNYEYKFEPSSREILDMLIPQLIRMHVHHIILESNASEHSARMIAMKNASENASELISELSLQYNKSRQDKITRELIEITAGREAFEQ